MPALLPCPPAQVETVRHTRFLGPHPVPAGQHGKVLGIAADDRFVYATYHRAAIAAPNGSPEPGELVVLDQALLADPGADPVVARVGWRSGTPSTVPRSPASRCDRPARAGERSRFAYARLPSRGRCRTTSG